MGLNGLSQLPGPLSIHPVVRQSPHVEDGLGSFGSQHVALVLRFNSTGRDAKNLRAKTRLCTFVTFPTSASDAFTVLPQK